MVPNTALGHYFFSLQEHTSLNRMQVGYRAISLSELHLEGFPLPTAFAISNSFLNDIAEANHLFDFLERMFSTPHWNHPEYIAQESAAIQQHILQLRLPEKIVAAFTQAYTHWWEEKFFAIRPSFIHPQVNADHLSELHVQGESNVLESILKVWARMYQIQELSARAEEWKMGIKIPAALVLQEMVTAQTSGWAIAERNKHGQYISLFSHWGITEFQPHQKEDFDRFTVDVKSKEITDRHIQVKKHQYIHHQGRLDQVLVPLSKQAAASLTEQEALEIAELVERIQKKHFEPMRIEWAVTPSKVFLLDVRSVVEADTAKKITPKLFSTAKVSSPLTLVAHLDSLARIPQGGEHAHAVVVAHPEEVFQSYGANPFRFLEKNKGTALTGYIKEVLLRLHQKFPHQSVFYTTHNFASSYFNEPGHSSKMAEENPEYGYRGAIQIVHNYGLLDREIDAIEQVIRQTKAQYKLVLPFVRTVAELSIILKHIDKKLPKRPPELEIWMKASTVENFIHIDQYARQKVDGIILDLPQLFVQAYGLDPTNEDLLKLYAVDISLLQSFLHQVREKTHQLDMKLYVDMGRYQPEILETVTELQFAGVCVRPQDIERVKRHATDPDRAQRKEDN
jgi:phosphoenolpyruvate synthase/pyruvate phosphate dikinase